MCLKSRHLVGVYICDIGCPLCKGHSLIQLLRLPIYNKPKKLGSIQSTFQEGRRVCNAGTRDCIHILPNLEVHLYSHATIGTFQMFNHQVLQCIKLNLILSNFHSHFYCIFWLFSTKNMKKEQKERKKPKMYKLCLILAFSRLYNSFTSMPNMTELQEFTSSLDFDLCHFCESLFKFRILILYNLNYVIILYYW